MRAIESSSRVERWALWILLGFTFVAVAGYWNFVIHPERLPATSLAARFYTISFGFFGRLHIVLAGTVLAFFLASRLGARWIPAFLLVYGVAFLAEFVGTGYGVPFGAYGYTGLLGPKLGGRVPLLIPVSWFLMAFPSWVVVRRALPARANRWRRVTLGALWLAAWDMALDPAMSFLTPYWHWEHVGPYYKMPLVNLMGWYLTGVVLMSMLDVLGERLGAERLPVGWLAAYYGILLLMPLGMVMAAGLGLATMATLASLALCAFLTWGVPWPRRRDDAAEASVPGSDVRPFLGSGEAV